MYTVADFSTTTALQDHLNQYNIRQSYIVQMVFGDGRWYVLYQDPNIERAVGDTIATVDSMHVVLNGVVPVVVVNTPIGVTESLSRTKWVKRSPSDTPAVTDLVARAQQLARSKADTQVSTDGYVRTMTEPRGAADLAVAAVDSVGRIFNPQRTAADTVTDPVDTLATIPRLFKTPLDSVIVADVAHYEVIHSEG
jgi:hypothetical protein